MEFDSGNDTEKYLVVSAMRDLLHPIDELEHDERNARLHSEKNLDAIARSLTEFGQRTPIVVQLFDGKKIIRKGNGTVEAMRRLGWTHVAAVMVEENNLSASAYAVADNRTAELATWDYKVLQDVLAEIDSAELDISMTGFQAEDINELLAEIERQTQEPEERKYTNKIKAPVYEPRGIKPKVSELLDDSMTNTLSAKIRAQNLPVEIESFLLAATTRHTIFNYSKIADYYAESSPEIQRLFEESALVIIDFDAAIENGFVKVSDRIMELAGMELEADEE